MWIGSLSFLNSKVNFPPLSAIAELNRQDLGKLGKAKPSFKQLLLYKLSTARSTKPLLGGVGELGPHKAGARGEVPQ
jgi:hypothetical protein